MPSSGMLCCVALVKTDVSEELSASIIRVTRIGELGTILAITRNWLMLWSYFINSIQAQRIFVCLWIILPVAALRSHIQKLVHKCNSITSESYIFKSLVVLSLQRKSVGQS
jgi:hypothetical protein